ncbi:hypothetical protein D0Z03_002100 [Geotrichum reessii]|nr:hypothetical protein D0Z03_002100 [Galactomyces reessii]
MDSIVNQLSSGRVILASQSPRRKQILEEQLGFTKISVIPSLFKEDLDKSALTPFQYVLDTATHKALDIYRSEIDADKEPSLVIGADTIILSSTDQILEKPRSKGHHFEMLKSLRDAGSPHKVFTAVVCIVPYELPIHPGYALESHIEETEVHFDSKVTDQELLSYVESGEAADAAGGYKIQGRGAVFIKSIKGDYFNVMGLPVYGTKKLIQKVLELADNANEGESGGESP